MRHARIKSDIATNILQQRTEAKNLHVIVVMHLLL